MSGEIPRPLGSIALVATLLVSGVGVTVPASANDCLAAPNSPAPQGSHWYYRLDWATQRKCWYVRALGPSAQQAVAPATLARITSVQPKSAQAITATTDKLVQRSANEGNTAPSIMEAPAPQASTSLQTGAQAVGPAPAAPVALPDAPPAVAPVNAPAPIAVPTDAPADLAPDDAERAAKPTKNAGMPMIIFPILALGLTVVGTLSMKIAAARRTRTIKDHAEFDWVNDQRQHEWRDDQHGSVDERREYQSLISAVSDPFRAEGGADQITHEISKRRDKLAQLHQDLDRLLQSPTAV
jgi:hypothetical protein